MSRSNHPPAPEHPEDLLLLFVQNLLDPTEHSAVEAHVATCSRCATTLKNLQEIIALLHHHREALCPSAWRVYELVREGMDPEGVVSAHLATCPRCRSLAQELVQGSAPEPLPEALWEKIKKRLPAQAAPGHPIASDETSVVFESRASWFTQLFRFPTLAAAAVAAVILVAVLYPRGMPEEFIALSPVSWEEAARPKGWGPDQKRVAVVLILRDFKERYPQEHIDGWFRALSPTMELSQRYHILTPSEVRNSLRRGQLASTDSGDILATLSKDLAPSLVAILTIRQQGQHFRIDGQLIDGQSGGVQARTSEQGVPLAQVPEKLRSVFLGLLGG